MANLGREVFGAGTASGPYVYGRLARTITITPLTASKALTLGNICPCGSGTSQWAAGAPRDITTCPTQSGSTCQYDQLWWYNGVEFGLPAYAKGTLNASTLPSLPTPTKTLAFSSWSASYTDVATATLNFSLQDSGAACLNSDNSDSFCGGYLSKCLTTTAMGSVPTYYSQNVQDFYLLGGDTTPDGQADGPIELTRSFFNNTGNPINPCITSAMGLEVQASGYFSAQDLPDNVNQTNTGYQSLLVQYNSLTVTPLSPEFVNYLQDACPCANGDMGGLWVLNQPRTLTYCGPNNADGTRACEQVFQAGIFPGGSLTNAGYGVIQLTDNQLRISELVPVASSGPTQVFNSSTAIVDQTSACANPQPSASLCGQWHLPCHSIANTDSGAAAAFASSGIFIASGRGEACSECFYMNTTYFFDENGCEENSPHYFVNVEQNGHYGVMGPSNANQIRSGNKVQVTSQLFAVTPLSQEAVTDLSDLCPCGGTWQLNVARTFSGPCPSGTGPQDCQYDLFRQQIGGGQQFVVMQHLGNNMRFTRFSPSQSAGWDNANLTMQDYQYTADSQLCNVALPAGASFPDGPNPHPSPQGSPAGDKGMSGGDVFILLLFIVVIVYFGGGMAYNFQTSGGFKNGGTPVIPHVEFWRGIPGLIAEGCNFTFTQRCGTKGKGPSYTSFGGKVDSDFGNTSAEGGSGGGGYGAL